MPHRSQLTVHSSPLPGGEARLLLKRARHGNRAILLWGTVLQQRPEHLAERGSDEWEVPEPEPVCLLREQPGETGGSEWGRDWGLL